MTEISSLERKMLNCNKQCAEHGNTVKSVSKLEKCMASMKNSMNKLKNKTSWIMGLLFFAALIFGYTLSNINALSVIARKQEGKNQKFSDTCIQVQRLTTAQRDADITFAQIKSDLKYMKKNIDEIKQILKKKRAL